MSSSSALERAPAQVASNLPATFYARWVKRPLDVVLSGAALILFSPLLVLVSALVALSSTGPPFFFQERLGRGARVFRLVKFRTMVHRDRAPDTEFFQGSDDEITPIGRWLRRLKLDELPQLVNVFAGHMSLVGPRPQLPIQLESFDDNARVRLVVRPGLTGLAQVHGNTLLSWPERWYYDARYVRTLSFSLDAWIVLRTIGVIVRGEQHYLQRPSMAPEHPHE